MPRAKAFDETVVLERAMGVFWTKGFHATSISDLVAALGINRASLYGTYGDKETLFQRALRHYQTKQGEEVRKYLSSQPSGKTAIASLFRRAVREGATDPLRRGCFVVNVTAELGASHPSLHEFLMRNERSIEGLFREALTKAVTDGEIDPTRDLDALATMLFVLYNGIRVLSKVHDEPRELERAVEEAMRILE